MPYHTRCHIGLPIHIVPLDPEDASLLLAIQRKLLVREPFRIPSSTLVTGPWPHEKTCMTHKATCCCPSIDPSVHIFHAGSLCPWVLCTARKATRFAQGLTRQSTYLHAGISCSAPKETCMTHTAIRSVQELILQSTSFPAGNSSLAPRDIRQDPQSDLLLPKA
jgi:hypothetical protein